MGDEEGSNLGDFVADDANASTEDKAESFLLREEIDAILQDTWESAEDGFFQ